MELTLTVLRCPDSVVPEQRRVPGGDYRLGRGADCDWVLPDPDRLLSKQHCVLEFRSGGWEVRDTSTNGTFVNHAAAPVGREQSAVLNDGDRIRLGAYEIEIRVEQAAAGSWGGGSMPAAAPGWEDPPPPRPEWNAAPPPRQAGEAWQASGWEQAAQPTRQQDPMAPRVAGDPFAMPGLDASTSGFGTSSIFGGGAGGFGAPPAAAPAGGMPDSDPFAAPAADPFASEAMPDHRPSTSDAFLPPRAMQQVSAIPDDWDLDLSPKPTQNQGPPPPAPAAPAGAIPDDWDLDLTPKPPAPAAPVPPPAAAPRPPAPEAFAAQPFADAPPAARAPAPPAADPFQAPATDPFLTPAAAPPPVAPPAPPPPAAFPEDFDLSPMAPAAPPVPPAAAPVAPPPTTQFRADASDPFNEDVPVAQGPAPPAPVVVAAVTPVAPVPVAVTMPPPPATPPPAAPAPQPAAYVPVPGGGDAGAGLAAFLAGAGLPPQPLRASPEETLQALGAIFAQAIGGMRALLIARSDVKREFRIEATMLRAGANNPVKFSATDEAAVAGLIAAGTDRGRKALDETVADLTAHQVATLAATQAAARALLDKLAPAGLETSEQGGGGLFGASREKKLWEAYKKLHQQVSDQFDDDFDSAFGKEFARAYEQASKR
ncbi:MAG TPA: type VI secretion system-associated FHA domain protein TagH [Roseomonas sp.]